MILCQVAPVRIIQQCPASRRLHRTEGFALQAQPWYIRLERKKVSWQYHFSYLVIPVISLTEIISLQSLPVPPLHEVQLVLCPLIWSLFPWDGSHVTEAHDLWPYGHFFFFFNFFLDTLCCPYSPHGFHLISFWHDCSAE